MYYQLKEAYFYLRRIAYHVTGNLVSTREELITKLAGLPVDRCLATELLQALESYEEHKPKREAERLVDPRAERRVPEPIQAASCPRQTHPAGQTANGRS